MLVTDETSHPDRSPLQESALPLKESAPLKNKLIMLVTDETSHPDRSPLKESAL